MPKEEKVQEVASLAEMLEKGRLALFTEFRGMPAHEMMDLRRRLREKGVANSRRGTRGDQIVEVVLQAPKAQDERTREILRELARLHPEDPRAELWSKV